MGEPHHAEERPGAGDVDVFLIDEVGIVGNDRKQRLFHFDCLQYAFGWVLKSMPVPNLTLRIVMAPPVGTWVLYGLGAESRPRLPLYRRPGIGSPSVTAWPTRPRSERTRTSPVSSSVCMIVA